MRVQMQPGDQVRVTFGTFEIVLSSFLHKPDSLDVSIDTAEGKMHNFHSPVHAGWMDLSLASEDGLLDSLINGELRFTLSKE